MKLTHYICALSLCLWSLAPAADAQSATVPALRGTITDPSGALVPGALVQLRGPGGEQRKTTGVDGQYAFPVLKPGKYNVRVIAKGFTVAGRQDVEIDAPVVLDAQLLIQADTQVLNVERVCPGTAREGTLGSLGRPRRVDAAVAGDGRTWRGA
jgi:hypothetical protein